MPILETFQKQPADVQDYDIDFTEWLAGFSDIGLSLAVQADTGITVVSSEFANGVAKVWLSGGTTGMTYKITARMTTTGGRVKEVEIRIRVKED
jgi:hypothetical protein